MNLSGVLQPVEVQLVGQMVLSRMKSRQATVCFFKMRDSNHKKHAIEIRFELLCLAQLTNIIVSFSAAAQGAIIMATLTKMENLLAINNVLFIRFSTEKFVGYLFRQISQRSRLFITSKLLRVLSRILSYLI
jgi:hypothetical protein